MYHEVAVIAARRFAQVFSVVFAHVLTLCGEGGGGCSSFVSSAIELFQNKSNNRYNRADDSQKLDDTHQINGAHDVNFCLRYL